MGVITEEARHWADRDYPPFEMQVTATDIAKFAHATGETNPIYFDTEAAVEAGYRDVVAPTLFSYVVRMHASALVTSDQLEPDGVAHGRRAAAPHPPSNGGRDSR